MLQVCIECKLLTSTSHLSREGNLASCRFHRKNIVSGNRKTNQINGSCCKRVSVSCRFCHIALCEEHLLSHQKRRRVRNVFSALEIRDPVEQGAYYDRSENYDEGGYILLPHNSSPLRGAPRSVVNEAEDCALIVLLQCLGSVIPLNMFQQFRDSTLEYRSSLRSGTFNATRNCLNTSYCFDLLGVLTELQKCSKDKIHLRSDYPSLFQKESKRGMRDCAVVYGEILNKFEECCTENSPFSKTLALFKECFTGRMEKDYFSIISFPYNSWKQFAKNTDLARHDERKSASSLLKYGAKPIFKRNPTSYRRIQPTLLALGNEIISQKLPEPHKMIKDFENLVVGQKSLGTSARTNSSTENYAIAVEQAPRNDIPHSVQWPVILTVHLERHLKPAQHTNSGSTTPALGSVPPRTLKIREKLPVCFADLVPGGIFNPSQTGRNDFTHSPSLAKSYQLRAAVVHEGGGHELGTFRVLFATRTSVVLR